MSISNEVPPCWTNNPLEALTMRFDTKAVHSGEEVGKSSKFGDVVAPIHMASTFARVCLEEPLGGYEYSRAANPTRHALEERLAALEGANGALAFSSGMGAELTALLLLGSGKKVIVNEDVYGGTFRLFKDCLNRFRLESSFIDMTDPCKVDVAFSKGVDMAWIETPTNPLLRVVDIRAIADLAHEINENALVVVDNTFASPFFQRPLELGADIVVYSTTKYISGHSDVIGGALLTNDQELLEQLGLFQRLSGTIPSPLDCFLILRGIKTLHLRMARHQENAIAVARFLEDHPFVDRVNYPGLESHPQYELARRQMSGFSGMVSFEASSSLDLKKILESTRVFSLAESLGGVESLIEHPASMTHRGIPPEQRNKAGLSDMLIRLSCGVESKDDLIDDLAGALKAGLNQASREKL
jgi:cystathionine gamma-lyase